jgi:hypothetical protein
MDDFHFIRHLMAGEPPTGFGLGANESSGLCRGQRKRRPIGFRPALAPRIEGEQIGYFAGAIGYDVHGPQMILQQKLLPVGRYAAAGVEHLRIASPLIHARQSLSLT